MTIDPNISKIQKKKEILLLEDAKLIDNPATVYKILDHVNAYVYAVFGKEIHLLALQKFFGTRAYKQVYLLMNDIIEQYILSYKLVQGDQNGKLIELKNDITSKKSISESILYFFILYFTIVVELLENPSTNSVVDKQFLIKLSNHYYLCYKDKSAVVIYLVSAVQFKYNLIDCLQIFDNVSSFMFASKSFSPSEKHTVESKHHNLNIDLLRIKSYHYLLDLTVSNLPFFAIKRNTEASDQLSGTRIKIRFKDFIDTNTDITDKKFWHEKLESGLQDNKKLLAKASTIQKSSNQKSKTTRPLNGKQIEPLNPRKDLLSSKLQIYKKFQENHPHINVQIRIKQLSKLNNNTSSVYNKKVMKTEKAKNKSAVQAALHYLLKYQKHVDHRKLFVLLITLFAALAVAFRKYSSYFSSIVRKLFS